MRTEAAGSPRPSSGRWKHVLPASPLCGSGEGGRGRVRSQGSQTGGSSSQCVCVSATWLCTCPEGGLLDPWHVQGFLKVKGTMGGTGRPQLAGRKVMASLACAKSAPRRCRDARTHLAKLPDLEAASGKGTHPAAPWVVYSLSPCLLSASCMCSTRHWRSSSSA